MDCRWAVAVFYCSPLLPQEVLGKQQAGLHYNTPVNRVFFGYVPAAEIPLEQAASFLLNGQHKARWKENRDRKRNPLTNAFQTPVKW